MSNREVSYPSACTTSGSRNSWASSLYCCRSVSPYTAITFASSSLLFQTSREIRFNFQHFIQVCFYFLGKKTGGAQAPPAPPLATALPVESRVCKRRASRGLTSIFVDSNQEKYFSIWQFEAETYGQLTKYFTLICSLI